MHFNHIPFSCYYFSITPLINTIKTINMFSNFIIKLILTTISVYLYLFMFIFFISIIIFIYYLLLIILLIIIFIITSVILIQLNILKFDYFIRKCLLELMLKLIRILILTKMFRLTWM
jgi:hypothetical protein